jgi:tape measure domain-containing protein
MDVMALVMRLKEEGAAQVRAALTSMRAGLKTTEKDAKQLTNAMDGLSQHARTLAGSLAAVAGGAATLRAIDTYAMMNNQLKLATTSTEGFVKAQADVIRIAQATNQPVEAVAQLYGRVSRAAAALGLSQEQVAKLTETVGQALIVSGADAGAAAGALTQLGQALAAGVVRAEEFNSIMDGAPALIQGVEKSLGLLPGALRKMSAEGKLSSQVFSQAILNATTISEQFGQMVPTLSQQMVGLRNQFVLIAGRIAETTGTTTKLGEAIQAVKQNLDSLIAVVASAVTAFVVYRSAVLTAAIASAVLASAETVAAFLSLTRHVRSLADASVLLSLATGGWAKLAATIAAIVIGYAAYVKIQSLIEEATKKATDAITQQANGLRYLGKVNASVHSVLSRPMPDNTKPVVDTIELLVELASVTALTAAQTDTLRSAEAQLVTQLSAGNIGLEQRVKLSKQLAAVQSAVGDQLALGLGGEPTTFRGVTSSPMNRPAMVGAINPAVIGQVRATTDAMGRVLDDAVTATMKTIQESMAGKIAGTFADAIAAGMQAAVATRSIGEGFRAFTAVLLSGIGDMLVKFGTQALLMSKLMASFYAKLPTNPAAAAGIALAMIAVGGALKGAATLASGGGGGGGSVSASVGAFGGGTGGGTARLPGLTFGPTSSAMAGSLTAAAPVNVTIIGPNDPSAQRQMQELIANAQRRGNV